MYSRVNRILNLSRCRGPTNEHNKQAQHIRRDALLDGARGHQAVVLRQQGGHLVARHHGHRTCQGRTTQLGAPPDEGVVLNPQE